jgi:hypothetical protein
MWRGGERLPLFGLWFHVEFVTEAVETAPQHLGVKMSRPFTLNLSTHSIEDHQQINVQMI